MSKQIVIYVEQSPQVKSISLQKASGTDFDQIFLALSHECGAGYNSQFEQGSQITSPVISQISKQHEGMTMPEIKAGYRIIEIYDAVSPGEGTLHIMEHPVVPHPHSHEVASIEITVTD